MQFYTLEEIARELHIAPATARNRLTLGQPMPPSIRLGRRRLFPVKEYEQWIAAQMEACDVGLAQDATRACSVRAADDPAPPAACTDPKSSAPR